MHTIQMENLRKLETLEQLPLCFPIHLQKQDFCLILKSFCYVILMFRNKPTLDFKSSVLWCCWTEKEVEGLEARHFGGSLKTGKCLVVAN